MEFAGRKRISTQLNITSLIDIVFLLLIFFMFSSHFIAEPGIKITLPTAVTARPYQQEDIIIFISRNNQLYLNNERVDLETLLDKLGMRIRRAEKKSVIIKADERIDLGLAVKVMDIAKQAGAQGLVISTRAQKNAE